MKVLQIHNTYLEPGGEDGVVRRERALLQNRGHEVTQLEFQNPSSVREQSRDLLLASWNPQSLRRARSELVGSDLDVVHVHNTWYSASPSVVAEAHRHAPVVATLHNYRRICLNAYLYRDGRPCLDCVGTLPWRGVMRRCYRGSLPSSVAIGAVTATNRIARTLDRSIDRFLVLSDFAADVTEQAGVESSSIVRHDNFVGDPGERTCAPSDSDVVLAIGRFSPEKGFTELVQAWNDHGPAGLRLVVVGDGPERQRLEAIAGRSVELIGRTDAAGVAALMGSSRALLFPSRWFEGQPLVLLEALAAGLPILTSSHPPLREVVDGAGQIVVDHDEWNEALEALRDDDWLTVASRRARERYEARFTPEVAGARLEEIYDDVRA